MKIELSSISRSFASDLAKLPEWSGPKTLDHFCDQDWIDFGKYVATDDGTLSGDDQKLCDDIENAIENAVA